MGTIAPSASTEGRWRAVTEDDDEPLGNPCLRERADELSALRSWILRHEVRIETTDVPLFEPVDGGAALSRVLEAVRGAASTRERPG